MTTLAAGSPVPRSLLRRSVACCALGALLLMGCTRASRQPEPGSVPPATAGAGPPVAGAEPAGPASPAADETRVLGMLPADDAEAVSAPASVGRGESFVVTVTTHGNGCDRLGDTGVIRSEGGATLMVYDLTRANRPGVMCTMILKMLRHEVTLSFDRPGEAVIRVWGRRAGAGGPDDQPVVIERRVTVRP